ncbi:hypothetical protein [Phaeobacter sp. B1627]|uniref:hypothetical protein n=1 Tax=Phaeobacter sp. B1627 TaxID=2583809 RepID=UPI00111B0408|nr:hypothetical protein [Phaeobacter sp. B1627]TNJ42757.1 hypothetical protein FGE21_10695 [Phaeobacter sp. B1627]
MANSQTTTAEALATKENALPDRGLALIGLFGPQDALQGLVRLSSGRIKTVEAGERLTIGQIVAIDAEGLLVERRGTVARLPILSD